MSKEDALKFSLCGRQKNSFESWPFSMLWQVSMFHYVQAITPNNFHRGKVTF